MAAQLIGEKFEAPAHIAISLQGADAPVLAIDQRLALVNESRNVVETGPDKS